MHKPLPIQGPNDPRIPFYRAMREEWKLRDRVTEKYTQLEEDAKALTHMLRGVDCCR